MISADAVVASAARDLVAFRGGQLGLTNAASAVMCTRAEHPICMRSGGHRATQHPVEGVLQDGVAAGGCPFSICLSIVALRPAG